MHCSPRLPWPGTGPTGPATPLTCRLAPQPGSSLTVLGTPTGSDTERTSHREPIRWPRRRAAPLCRPIHGPLLQSRRDAEGAGFGCAHPSSVEMAKLSRRCPLSSPSQLCLHRDLARAAAQVPRTWVEAGPRVTRHVPSRPLAGRRRVYLPARGALRRREPRIPGPQGDVLRSAGSSWHLGSGRHRLTVRE